MLAVLLDSPFHGGTLRPTAQSIATTGVDEKVSRARFNGKGIVRNSVGSTNRVTNHTGVDLLTILRTSIAMKFRTRSVCIIVVVVVFYRRLGVWTGVTGTRNGFHWTPRKLAVAVVAEMFVSVADMRGRLATISALPGQVLSVFGGILANGLGLGSTRRTQPGFGQFGGGFGLPRKIIGAFDGSTKVGILAVAAEVKGVLAHGLLVESLLGKFRGCNFL